ncbi:hypothetical protein HKD37_12G033402 [Glycine soja]|nr:hypothetical protein JHK87_032996 [Glycine soja]KAH1220480.1 hypothetical protein GmHk_12G034116 [Glycine max]
MWLNLLNSNRLRTIRGTWSKGSSKERHDGLDDTFHNPDRDQPPLWRDHLFGELHLFRQQLNTIK